MKNEKFTTIGLTLVAFIGVGATAFVKAAEGQTPNDRARAQPYGGSLDAREHGYEHAYRDGADQGRQDREKKMPYSWRDNDYWGGRGYERAFGDRNEYMDGY